MSQPHQPLLQEPPEPFILGLNLNSKRCLVIGSGPEQAERVTRLLNAGAQVTVIAESLAESLTGALASGIIQHKARAFCSEDLLGVWLALQVDGDQELAAQIFEQAEAQRVLFCATDLPHSNFSNLAVARAGKLAIAISTQGAAPGLAKKLREELERLLSAANAGEHLARLEALRGATPKELRKETMRRALGPVRLIGKLLFE